MKEKEIKVTVRLDDKNVPEDISWSADDQSEAVKGKAFLLSVFDKQSLDTLKIDLWTKEMQIHEMDRFVFQTLRGITDTYYKATNNAELANEMQRFVHYFGEKTGLIEEGDSK
jgi:gliding motility-associated protein GldC